MSTSSKNSSYFESEYLINFPESKEKFIKHVNACDEEEAQNIYRYILFLVIKSIENDKRDDLKHLNWFINFMSSVKSEETLSIYYNDFSNPFLQCNIIIYACKHNGSNILEYLFSEECTLINNLSIKVKNDRILPSDEDDNCRNAFYYAIINNNCQLLETLASKWPMDYFKRNPEELDQLLSLTYKELKLKNIVLSDEIQVKVKAVLINIRFYDDQKVQNSNTVELIHGRVQLVLESINSLISSFTNIKEDENFLLIAKFIAENLFILKQQLKCTYNKLPWEEMEFCLTIFVSSRIQPHEFNLFYSFVLTKNKILSHLENFASILCKEIKNIGGIDLKKLRKLPYIKRNINIEFICENAPTFKDLYSDYQLVRDLYSLETIESYISLALSVDPTNEEECLIIKRTVQIMGEHLKNTLESPKLSDSSCELILSFLPKNTLQIVAALRNSFSHTHSFRKWQWIQANADADFFKNIQDDVKHISSVVLKILSKTKINILKLLLESIIKCETFEELEKIMKILNGAEVKTVLIPDNKFLVDDVNHIEELIEEINVKITNKTTLEENLLCKLIEIITSEKNKVKETNIDYFAGFTYFSFLSSHFTMLKLNRNHMIGIKFGAMKIFESITSNIETESLKEISSQALELLQFNINKKDVKGLADIVMLIKKLFILIGFQVGNVKWLEDLMLKLSCYKFAGIYTEITFTDEKNNIKSEFISKLSSKLCTLKKVMHKIVFGNQIVESYLSYKGNHKLKVIIETLILDVLCILNDSGCLTHNLVFLDHDSPLLLGKALRNHLAHNNALLNVFQADHSISLFINASKLALENFEYHRQIGKVVKSDLLKLRIKHKRELKVIDLKQAMFDLVVSGDVEKLRHLIKEGADIKARSFNLWTVLHFASMGGSVEMMKFLLYYNVSVNDKDHYGRTPLHIASFYGQSEMIKFLTEELKMKVDDIDIMKQTPLLLAAQNGHKSAVDLLIKSRANIKIKDSVFCSPLFYAITNNHINVVQILFNEGSVDEIVQFASFTSLHVAAENGHLEIVDLLLKKGAKVDAVTGQHATSLHLSALNGHVDIVTLLIRKGANVNNQSITGSTPLHNAAEYGHEKIVQILLKHGAIVNVIGEFSFTPLHFAAKNGYLNIVKILVKNKANINIAGMGGLTPLHYAANNGHLDIVEFLCNKKTLHSKDQMGFTALHCSCSHGHEHVVHYLLKEGAEICSRDVKNRTPLHLAAMNGHTKVIEILTSKGIDLNCTDASGCSALHLSTAYDKENVTEFLLNKGATINLRDNFHVSPLHSAIKNYNMKILKLLLARGADINLINSQGLKALHFGALYGSKEIVEELIKQNADVNDVSFVQTPLHLAVLNNTIDVVELLIENGAKVDSEDKSRSTPLCIAVKRNDKEVVKMLIKYGANINVKDGYPLYSAIHCGFYEIFELLIENEKIKINMHLVKNITLLHVAAELSHRVIVEALISKGADVNAIIAGSKVTPLHSASKVGAAGVVKVLLKNEAKINARTVDGSTPLHWAVHFGHANVVKQLVEHSANINIAGYKNRTAIELAVCHGRLEIVKMLSEMERINIHDKANDGFSLLHIAAQCGHLEIMKHLIEKGADINSVNDAGTKPIHFAAREGHKDIVQFLLDLDPTGKHLTPIGQTVVHYAIMGGQTDVLEFLIERKYDINASSIMGELPIHIAVNANNEDILKILLHHGAFYDAIYMGCTPLKIAEKRNYMQCVDLLVLVENFFKAVKKNNILEVERFIKNGIAVNVRNADNITPLYYACWRGYESIVDILLKNKADPNILGKGNCTPLHYAAKFNHFTIVKCLLLHGGIYNAKSSNHKTPLDFTTHDEIKNLLLLVDESFKKVKNGDTEIIPILKRHKNRNILRCILNAHDRESKTLIVAGIHSDFPKLKQLKSLSEDGLSSEINRAYKLCDNENYQEAASVFESVLDKRKELFAEDSLEILEIQEHQALALYKSHKYHRALELFESIYQKQKRIFGISYSGTLKTRGYIAHIFYRLGKHEEALIIFREIVPKLKEKLGSNHVQVLQTQCGMALALDGVGEYEEALGLNYELYNAYKTIFHSNHPSTLVPKNNIAVVLLHQRKLDKSLRIFEEVYEARKKVLGQNHSDTLRTYSHIATVQAAMDEADNSESLKETFNLQKTTFGLQNHDTINTQINTAINLFRKGRHNEAKKMYEDCMANATMILGQNHPDVHFIKKMLEALERGQRFSGSQKDDKITCSPIEDMHQMLSDLKQMIDRTDDHTDEQTELHHALNEGSIIKVQNLLKKRIDLLTVSNSGDTALHLAVSKGCSDIVEVLLHHMKENNHLKFRDFINAKTSGEGNTALHVAPNLKTALCLLSYGAIFNIKNKKEETPLAVTENEDIRRILQIIHGLFDASESGNVSIIDTISKLKQDEISAVLTTRNLRGESLLQSVALYRPSFFSKLKTFLNK